MNLSRRLSAGLAAAALGAGTAVAGVAAAGAAPPSDPAPPVADRSGGHTLTLVTGDRVTVSADGGQVSAQAGPGRKGITFTTTTAAGRVQVVPSDAGALLAAGRLDPRLFDVTELVESGYDRRDQLPLIVTGGPGTTVAATRASVAAVDGLAKVRDLPAVNGVAVRQPRDRAVESWRALAGGGATGRSLRSGVAKVWLDGMRKPSLDVSVPQIGAPAAWGAGYTGAGATVAVLDSGVDDTHPDLAGQVIGRANFTEDYEPDADMSGHGTHVAATIAGTGAGSGGKYKGVAPGAKLLDGKVCAIPGCAESWIIAGMTWAAADQHAEVVNLSLGGEDDPEVVDPVEQAVQDLTDQYGTLFVIAAGNADGVTEGVISSPGTAPAALTVGAVDDKDALADFSRRGPRAPDGGLKPEITAPGVNIMAARGKDAIDVPGARGDAYTTLSGTSMAAPHVAGAAAILAQRHADWDPKRLKAALMSSAQPNQAFGAYAQGAGRVDVARAVRQDVISVTGGVSLGEQRWPHADDPVLTREVTYRNDGPAGVTLALTMDTFSPDDTPTPAGMFTVDRPSVEVPAGGEAKVTVTVDTRVPGPDGYVGGWLTATAPDLVVRTPVAVHKEVESYDVLLTHRYRAGSTPRYANTTIALRGSDSVGYPASDQGQGGNVTVRVPKGHYTLTSELVDTSAAVLLAQPELYVDRPLTVDLDAQLGQPISVTVPRSSAQQILAYVSAMSTAPHSSTGKYIEAETFANIYTAQLGPDSGDDNFTSAVGGQWAQAKADGSTDDSPYFYSLLFPIPGRMITGYQRSVAERELAQVHIDFAASQPGTIGLRRVGTGLASTGSGFFGPFMSYHLPFRRVEYYNADPGVGSTHQFLELSGEVVLTSTASTPNIVYDAGRTYSEEWNRGVFAPSLPAVSLNGWEGVFRAENTIGIDVPMFSDGAGRPGAGDTEDFSATLFRDGTKIGTTGEFRWSRFEVPAAEASYRLAMHAELPPAAALSTSTDIAWTFRSGRVAAEAPTALPLWTVRFSPKLDQYNRAPARGPLTVPMSITAQPGSQTGKLVSRSVEASFDDGVTWRPVPVTDGAVLVPQPGGSGFVSLRAKAADSEGNTVEQTVIRAYRYGTAK
ncbi:S8 family serine peptidase [Micromonospora sp. NBC_00858]|uniref:S8 family serine peptidase n=1 Tax=Micromonospora sp. NBC_00858 TaxID=2975979 RepID=UPI00386412B3|nr:S8 family serine peptidase [Micromonospora sp. NBC_00858]